MHIDKMIKKEIIGVILTTIILLTVFIGVSYASFFSVDEGEELVIEVGDIDVTFCKDVSCGEAYSNYGKVIGLQTVDGVSTPSAIYPYETTAEALESTPYIFNVENTGQMKVYFNAFLEEDTDFVPSGSYSSYTSITELYSNHVKVGVSECTGGNINTTDVDVYTFGELTNGKIIDNVEINTGEDKTYCVWTWLDKSAPNEVQETYFVANINFTAEYVPHVPWYETCTASSNNLNCKIITAQTPSSDENIDFAQISSDTNGNGLYYTSNLDLTEDYDGDGTGDRVYYYRGAVENNNVRFGGFCWRIVRTNEDGSVRLRYNGIYENGTCPTTGTIVSINSQDYAFNGSYNNEKYNEYIWEDGTGESLAKTTIDAWYTSSGLVNYANQIANVPYCADKSNPTVPTTGNYTSYTFYGAVNRLVDITTLSAKSDAQPTYKCADIEDKHTVAGDAWGGNGKLSKPIGLLTADEVTFAGGRRYQSDGSSTNRTYYLYTSANYWIISPFLCTGSAARSFTVLSSGSLGYYLVSSPYSLLPAVSLKAETMVNAQGDGTYTNPYVVE